MIVWLESPEFIAAERCSWSLDATLPRIFALKAALLYETMLFAYLADEAGVPGEIAFAGKAEAKLNAGL